MITLFFVAALSSTTGPESGFVPDMVATWVNDGSERRTEISLDADGRCMIVGTRKWNGATTRTPCGYWITGSTVHIRFTNPLGATGERPEIQLFHDRRKDELNLGGDDGADFVRAPLSKRAGTSCARRSASGRSKRYCWLAKKWTSISSSSFVTLSSRCFIFSSMGRLPVRKAMSCARR
jgi:hypothetical protein